MSRAFIYFCFNFKHKSSNLLLIFLIDLASSDNKEEAQLFLTCHKNADVKEFMFFNESLLSLITKYSKEKNISKIIK